MNSFRVLRRFLSSRSQNRYDAVIVGGGHNGLVCGAYLSKGGKKVCILEKRHVVGGAAVTEEMVPGYKFSRASYVLGLLRPQIAQDLELKKHGLKVHLRNPSSYTPLKESCWEEGKGKSLILGSDPEINYQQIAQFSKKDAEMFPKYEALLNKFADAIQTLLDNPPPDINKFTGEGLWTKAKNIHTLRPLLEASGLLGKDLNQFIELMTAPASHILDKWFESEPLKGTLATDSVIGAHITPDTPGSGYVLLHHVMACSEGVKGAWAYPEGGMGAVTQAMARSAQSHGAEIRTSEPVKEILLNNEGNVEGVETESGEKIYAPCVLSNATPYVTVKNLLPDGVSLPKEYADSILRQDYKSPVCKLNVALRSLPNFKSDPNHPRPDTIMPHHRCTIHLNCEKTSLLYDSYNQANDGLLPHRPMIEMTIPSSLDPTLAPEGHHVALFFTQYVPYAPRLFPWDYNSKKAYANKVFGIVEEYAEGFKDSVVDYEVLAPPDLEEIFGLTGGNIFHGAMSLDRLYSLRPSASQTGPETPIKGLYICGSGAHPGGGVMGAPGRLAAMRVLGKM